MKHADLECEYFSLSDQDDIWKLDKIEKAVEQLEKEKSKVPVLYCCAKTLVDQGGIPLSMEIREIKMKPSFGNALVENIATGCSCVFNRELLMRLREKEEPPKDMVMHDWWIYLTATCFGKVIYDGNSYLLYRQHEGNVIGARNTWMQEWKSRIHYFMEHRGAIIRQLIGFQQYYEVEGENGRLLQEVIEYKNSFHNRYHIAMEGKVYRQRKVDNCIFHILFFLKLV